MLSVAVFIQSIYIFFPFFFYTQFSPQLHNQPQISMQYHMSLSYMKLYGNEGMIHFKSACI